MKKLYIFLVLLAIFSLPVFAQDEYDENRIVFNWNLGNLGGALNTPLTKPLSYETTLSILNIGIEDRYTNIGIEFNPFMYYYGWPLPENMEYYLEDYDGYISLLNLKVY